MATGICRYSGYFFYTRGIGSRNRGSDRLLRQASVVYYDKPRSSIMASLGRLLWQALVGIRGEAWSVVGTKLSRY